MPVVMIMLVNLHENAANCIYDKVNFTSFSTQNQYHVGYFPHNTATCSNRPSFIQNLYLTIS